MPGKKRMKIDQYCAFHKETKLVPRVVGMPISVNSHTAYSDDEWEKFVRLEHSYASTKPENKDKIILVCPEDKCAYGEDFRGEIV